MTIEEKALEILVRDEVSNIDMAEGIRRGTMAALYAENGTVLLRAKGSFLTFFASDNEDDAREALLAHPEIFGCVAHGEIARDMLQSVLGLSYETPCRQYAYLSKQKPELDPRFTYRVLEAGDADYVRAHYKPGYEDIDAAIAAGRVIGAEVDGKLAGFIGMHGEGSVGMLEVDPAYRRLGVGTALEKFMFAKHIDEGRVAYGQVFVTNDGSLALQKKMGIEMGKNLIWWMFREDMRKKNSIYISRSGDGHVNLATDQFILERYRRGLMRGVTLYFYVNDNAVIIGRNQNAWRECNIERMKEDGVQLVRRHTGGGAVYHDGGNLNFSFITNEKLYDRARFDSVIIRAVSRLGLNAEVNGRNDLTVDGRKFSGCAYALSGVARGMHGTVLVNTDFGRLSGYLNPSKKKLAAKGVTSVRSRVVNLCELTEVSVERVRELIIEEFIKEFGEAEELVLDDAARDSIARMAEEQSSWEWMFGRSPEFDWQYEDRFSFGSLQLLMGFRNGEAHEVKVYTDSLDVDLPGELVSLLTGCRFDEAEIVKALRKGGAEANEIASAIEYESAVERARESLHSMPELALHEEKTKAFIKDFIEKHTTLELHDEGAYLYAVHREGAGECMVVRADFDAVPCEGGAAHLCGHNGHTAALLALALRLEGARIGKNVVLLFQPAEETGEGAPICASLFEKERISAVIGTHNIPGEPQGCVLLRRGTFACASCGLEIIMRGAPTHAAYPENGVNPTEQTAKLALDIPAEAARLTKERSAMTLATVVGMRTGERAFGVAASEGSLWVTLRSESGEALTELVGFAKSDARTMASAAGLELTVNECDPFPATVNDPSLVSRAESILAAENLPYKYLPAPFRWSEDFGHYAKYAPSLFFGIGSGESTAPLHTAGCEYPSGLAPQTGDLLFKLVKGM